MNGRVAKRLRREAEANGTAHKPKQFFKPLMLEVPTGEVDEDGNRETKPTYIPRRQRRALVRMFMTDLKKGRLQHGRNQ